MKRMILVVGGLSLCLPLVGLADPESPTPTVIATFSIAAVDPDTGECGAAVASKFPAVGKVVAHARSGVGAYCTQHYDIRASAPKALDLLAEKKSPEEVLAEILKIDKAPGQRQLAIIDMKGQSRSTSSRQRAEGKQLLGRHERGASMSARATR